MISEKPYLSSSIKRLRLMAAVAGAVLVLMIIPAPPAQADDAGFVAKINALRTAKGLSPLVVDESATASAQAWSEQMAAAGRISHNTVSASRAISGWSKLGQNVGTGSSAGAIFNALLTSQDHYNNMVDPAFTRIGVGVATGPDGRLYTTHDFIASAGTGTAAASLPSSREKQRAVQRQPRAVTTVPSQTTRRESRHGQTLRAPQQDITVQEPSSSIVQALEEISSMDTQG